MNRLGGDRALVESPVGVSVLSQQSPPSVPPALRSREGRSEGAARRTLREQVARLERELGQAVIASFPWGGVDHAVASWAGPRLLSLGELESMRDELAERLHQARAVLAQRGDAHEAKRCLVERMMLEPAAHKFARVTRDEVGERGCGGWEVRPRLGLIGMLVGWWRVKLSSGCPLAEGGPTPPVLRSA